MSLDRFLDLNVACNCESSLNDEEEADLDRNNKLKELLGADFMEGEKRLAIEVAEYTKLFLIKAEVKG